MRQMETAPPSALIVPPSGKQSCFNLATNALRLALENYHAGSGDTASVPETF